MPPGSLPVPPRPPRSSRSSFSLVARHVGRALGGVTVLAAIDVAIGPASRLGIVGPNGVGKTTLLRVLAGLEAPDQGSVTRTPATLRVGYLPQEPERSRRETVRGFLARRTGVAEATVRLEQAAAALAGDVARDAGEVYGRALDAYLASGVPDFEARIHATCADLGLSERLLDAPTAALSGGEAARTSLAAILLSRFDVFLLDEPTNDLDFAGLERLERFVAGVPGGVVVVSHDRTFLARAVHRVVEIDDHSRKATEYGGGWDAYQQARAATRRHAVERYETFREERRRLEERMRTQRQWSIQGVRAAKKSADGDKMQRDFRVNATERNASKVRATERALAHLEAVEKPWEGWDLRFRVATAHRSGDVVVRLTDAVVERGAFRLGPVDLEVGFGERVAVVGPNGSGKSTLLGAVLGDLPLAEGARWLGPGVVAGTMSQSRLDHGDRPMLGAFVASTGLANADARALLAKFGLGPGHVHRPTSSMSPGERTRADLARLAATGVNCLVVDEPTNHLDLSAIEQLEEALDGFDGTLLIVTHDRALLDAVRITRMIDPRGAGVS